MIPGFVDSHSHLVFAGDRTQEFNARMSGRPYSAGGIRTTVAATRVSAPHPAAGPPGWSGPGPSRRPDYRRGR